MRKTKMVTIRVSEAELREMKRVAQQRGVSLSRLIREAVTTMKEVRHEAKVQPTV